MKDWGCDGCHPSLAVQVKRGVACQVCSGPRQRVCGSGLGNLGAPPRFGSDVPTPPSSLLPEIREPGPRSRSSTTGGLREKGAEGGKI